MVLILKRKCNRKVNTHASLRRSVRHGFTLVEVIVALTVVSVAATVFISMFNAGLHAGRRNQDRAIALDLAEAHLAAILRTPGDYQWKDPGDAASFIIESPQGKARPQGYPCHPPQVTLITRSNQDKLAGRYAKFTWTALARTPQEDTAVYEVRVLIRWMDEGRPQVLSLTSALPKTLATGGKGT